MKKLLTIALLAAAMSCAPKESTTTSQTTETTATAATQTTATVAPSDTAATATAATTTVTTATTATTTTGTATTTAPPAPDKKTAKTTDKKPVEKEKSVSSNPYEGKIAEIHTEKGEIDIRFFPDVAPNHVKNFIDLANKGFYNGIRFHRVIAGFMIQGGDPNTISGPPSTWGSGGSPNKLKAEFNSVHHARGIVSAARTNDPNSASSQFFICVADAGFLDRQYTVFGAVTKGMDVADAIVKAGNGQELPSNPVRIEKVVIRDAKTPEEKAPTPK